MNEPHASESLTRAADLHRAGNLAEAEQRYREVLALQPENAEALHGLGVLEYQLGRLDVAADLMRRAVEHAPNIGGYWSNLAEVLRLLSRLPEAIDAGRKAVALLPVSSDAHNNLGVALLNADRPQEAISCFEQALVLRREFPSALNNLANAMKVLGLPGAEAYYLQAVALNPNYDDALNNIGVIRQEQRLLDDAVAVYRRVLTLNPRHSDACNNLAVTLFQQGQVKDSIEAHRTAVALNPANPQHHSNLLLALHYDPEQSPRALLQEHRVWAARHADPISAKAESPCLNDRTQDRPLRIGYISPRFRDTAEARFLLPLLSSHERKQFQIFCYSNSRIADVVTAQIRAHVDVWRDTTGISDSALADIIRRDNIDILVDLMSHGTQNRLLVFARKPAPVQITHLAYPSTTGMSAMSYRFTDPYLDPEQARTGLYAEESIPLESFWCYPGIPDAPAIAEPPCLKLGHVTFGCLNRYEKMSDVVVGYWIDILHAVPNARLMLHADPGSHRHRVESRFRAVGLGLDRLTWVPRVSWSEYLDFHARMDVALDPHPYAGGTTTCDALWMGVPVVSMPGTTAVSRAGASLLTHAGLPDLVAPTSQQYIRAATDLAMNKERLHAIRMQLRQQLRDSALTDGREYARHVEGAYREIWRRWCSNV